MLLALVASLQMFLHSKCNKCKVLLITQQTISSGWTLLPNSHQFTVARPECAHTLAAPELHCTELQPGPGPCLSSGGGQ